MARSEKVSGSLSGPRGRGRGPPLDLTLQTLRRVSLRVQRFGDPSATCSLSVPKVKDREQTSFLESEEEGLYVEFVHSTGNLLWGCQKVEEGSLKVPHVPLTPPALCTT